MDLAVAHLFLQKGKGAPDHLINQQPLTTGGSGPAKGAQVRDDLRRLTDLLHGIGQFAQELLRGRFVHLNLVNGIADEQADVVEWVVELMSHTGGQLAESCQLGRLDQLFLLVT